jgi:hypothetical protein
MENINSIIIPDFKAKKSRLKKQPQKILVEKQSLSRINRPLNCRYCESEKILNPDQYQNLFDLHGSEEKLKEEFFCKPCEMNMRGNPFLFWSIYGEHFHILSKNLKTVFEIYKTSSKSPSDAIALQTMSFSFLKECKISDNNYEFIIIDKLPIGMKIKNIPYVGTIVLNIYENRKNRITIE